MKIVIDIPDEAYELLKNKRVLDNIAESIIANGTPLPKGHGRLIDAKHLVEEHPLAFVRYVINDAPTIIEADGGDAE